MKICIDVSDINKFKDVTLSLDLDEKHNRITICFFRTDKDGDHLIKTDSFEVYEENKR